MTDDRDRPSHDDAPSEIQYHIDVGPTDVADTVLLPGNPERVDTVLECWDTGDLVGEHREYRTATGSYEGTPLSVTSTGIGSPSAAIAVEELARIGAETFIRVGSCGALHPDLSIGDLVITTGAVRQEGTSDEYVRGDYPAVADYTVVSALAAAAERLGYPYRTGVTMSADSFYAGQGRPGYGGFEAAGSAELLSNLRAANVTNIEMETSVILTLASLYGLRAGAVCTVFADRDTGEFATEGEAKAVETASLAAHLLARMDDRVRTADAHSWHAELCLE